jgi:N-acetylneuraminate synthase
MEPVRIGARLVGPGQPVFVIAEAGVNHNGNLDMAHSLVDAAAQAGADAVKFQTFKAERMVTPGAPKAEYQKQTTEAAESHYEMLQRLELSPKAHGDLMARCQEKGILFMSTPFDEESVDLLDSLGVLAFKVSSGEITNWPFLEYIARKGKPIILSTGMSYLSEVDEAARVIRRTGWDQLVLLHCVSNYPANPVDVNLRAMQTMAAAFQVPVGYSDHTLGIEIALAAVALGACVIEKHFTLNRNLPGPDHRASLEPDELVGLVQGIRTVEAALGHGRKEPAASEANTTAAARKSLVAACDVPGGTTLAKQLVLAKRPGSGLSPALLPLVLGRKLRRGLVANELIRLEDVE